VPSPSDNTAQANQYWLDSQSVSNIQCTMCHAADPFIWSSFVAQKADLAKWDPTGKYDSNFAGMFAGQWAIGLVLDRWPQSPAGYAPEAYPWALGMVWAVQAAGLLWLWTGRELIEKPT